MKVASEKLDGIVVLPGEEFSFRFFLGKQTKEAGYKEAMIFVKQPNGEVKKEDALGGGICQVSSTLHAACLDAKLKIKERHAHSDSVGYIPDGKDATISGDYYDLKFANNRDYPIVISMSLDQEKRENMAVIYRMDSDTT